MRRLPLRWAAAALVLLLAAGVAVQLLRPEPSAKLELARSGELRIPGTTPALSWPATGSAALYLGSEGWLGASPSQRPQPIASVTKVMTALLTLKLHPLAIGSGGPVLTIDAAAVATYRAEVAQGDSVLPVTLGERLTELQLLEGLLIPSGDNVARLLAQWDSGTEAAFVVRMNREAKALGMSSTRYADASGLDPGTVSTATDLVKLAVVAMRYPVFAQIVAMPRVVLPLAGVVDNYNGLLGSEGVVGIKTGWTAEAGGCLLFVADERVDGTLGQLYGAVLGQPGGPESGLVAAERVTAVLLRAAASSLSPLSRQVDLGHVASLRSSWGRSVPVGAQLQPSILVESGSRLSLALSSNVPHGSVLPGRRIGQLMVRRAATTLETLALVPERRLAGPSVWWRLLDF